MMFAPPPPPPPALTVQQQADLDCLDLGLSLQTTAPGKRPAVDLREVYLERLRKSDPTRNWAAQAAPLSQGFTYEAFAKRLNECETRARQEPKPR